MRRTTNGRDFNDSRGATNHPGRDDANYDLNPSTTAGFDTRAVGTDLD